MSACISDAGVRRAETRLKEASGYEQLDVEAFAYRNLFLDLRWISVFSTYLVIDWRARPNLLALARVFAPRDTELAPINFSPVSAALRNGAGPVSLHVGTRLLLGSVMKSVD